jgi:hypothetical protein
MNGLRHQARGLGLAVAIGLWGLWAAVAVADPARARAHFDLAKRYFQVAEYRKAIEEFKAAHIEEPDPAFLYNIAECHRHLGESKDALVFYRRFLTLAPSSAPTRAIVEKRIAELQAAPRVAAPAAPAVSSPAPRSPPVEPSPAVRAALEAPPPDPAASTVVVAPPAAAVPDPSIDDSIVAPAPERPVPFYRRAWFYAVVGGALIGGTLGVWAISSGGGKSIPETPLGNQPAFR